ncbi:hypothetical protein NR798_39760 [Archangium gephyra]|uniref:hypothetical protein n=1 Tax=Archangium gephyra TaxID=48 RepID=UPI0035D4C19A
MAPVVEAPKVSLPVAPTKSPDVEAPSPRTQALLPEVEALRGLVEQIQSATRESTALLARGRIEQMVEMAPRLLSLKDLIAQHVRAVEEKLAAHEVASPGPFPEAAVSELLLGEAYLSALNDCLQQAESRGTLKLQQQRAELIAEFERLELKPPEDLPGIKTLRELRARQDELKPLLDEQRAFRQLLSSDEKLARQARESLSLLKRLEFYENKAREERSSQTSRALRRPKDLLEALKWDGVALAHEPARGRRLLDSALIAVLDQELPIPQGTWRLFSSLCEAGGVVERLKELDVLPYLTIVPEALYDAEGLYDVVGSARERLPADLRGVLARIEISRLPLSERIPRLAAMALDGQLAEPLLTELLSALVQMERHADAVLLASMAVHASRRLQVGPAYESLLVFLVELADRSTAAHEFIGQNFLQDASWLHERTDEVVVLLYLAIRTGNRGPFENLQFLKSELLREAERFRPALVGRWLMPELKSGAPVDHVARQQALSSARQALKEWDHDLRKESCYRSWDYASDYQRLFKDRLTQLFEELEKSGSFQELDPLVFIEEVGREQRLPEARHPALPPMKKYLVDQMYRLKRIEDALPYLGGLPIREGLSRNEPDLHSELKQELQRLPGNSALRYIYQRAMERL